MPDPVCPVCHHPGAPAVLLRSSLDILLKNKPRWVCDSDVEPVSGLAGGDRCGCRHDIHRRAAVVESS